MIDRREQRERVGRGGDGGGGGDDGGGGVDVKRKYARWNTNVLDWFIVAWHLHI